MNSSPLRLGIVGASEGNGHPYSWSAIFNGYQREAMARCPYPGIPLYLAERAFPAESLGHLGRVTHLWTQDPAQSRDIADASLIPNIVDRPQDLIGAVDAVLLARDDAENHRHFVPPVLAAGLPVFVDKPLALRLQDAEELLALQLYEGQLFSCSSLRYSHELQVTEQLRGRIGPIRRIVGITPKRWETYAVHVVEPIVASFANEWGLPFPIRKHEVQAQGPLRRLNLALDGNVDLSFISTGALAGPIKFELHGQDGHEELVFRDSFSSFRAALEVFVTGIERRGVPAISRMETRQVVSCLELGLGSGGGLA